MPRRNFFFNDPKSRKQEYYLNSAIAEVDNLVDKCQLSSSSSLLDVGCGQGRLATGLIAKQQQVEKYVGIDVSMPAYLWCLQNIMLKHPTFVFHHLDVHNERYNANTPRKIDEKMKFPYADREFDIIYSFSVFNHMTESDARVYLKEFGRLLCGKGFMTLFLEDAVPNYSINPPDYLNDRYVWSGALHCVRYRTDYFLDILKESGLKADKIVPHKEWDGEADGSKELYFSKA